jgi:hypothetical protein
MDGDMNSNTQEVFVIDGIMTITPYCVSATLSSKPATTVIVSAFSWHRGYFAYFLTPL